MLVHGMFHGLRVQPMRVQGDTAVRLFLCVLCKLVRRRCSWPHSAFSCRALCSCRFSGHGLRNPLSSQPRALLKFAHQLLCRCSHLGLPLVGKTAMFQAEISNGWAGAVSMALVCLHGWLLTACGHGRGARPPCGMTLRSPAGGLQRVQWSCVRSVCDGSSLGPCGHPMPPAVKEPAP